MIVLCFFVSFFSPEDMTLQAHLDFLIQLVQLFFLNSICIFVWCYFYAKLRQHVVSTPEKEKQISITL